MKELQVTLYDVLGYLIPGATAFIGVIILMWTGFQTGPADLDRLSVHGWIACGVLSYLGGHLVQAIANLLMQLLPSHLSLLTSGKTPSLSSAILDATQQKAKLLAELDSNTMLTTKELLELCDNLVQEQGATETRDVYVYREGFYRGMVVASGLVAIAFALRAFYAVSVVKSGGITYAFERNQMAVLGILSAVAAFLFFQRYRRFGSYLTRFVIFGVLSIKSSKA